MANFFEIYKLLKSFFIKDIQIALSYKFNLALTFFALFFYIFFLLNLSEFVSLDGHGYSGSYFLYVILGLSIADFCLSISSSIRNEIMTSKNNGTFEEILISRFPDTLIISCMFTYPIFFNLIRVLVYFLIASYFSPEFKDIFQGFNQFLHIILVFFLSLIPYIGIGLISSSFIILFNRGDPIIYFNSAASALIAGIFYPSSVLPPSLQTISDFIPLKHSIDILRQLLLSPQETDLRLIEAYILLFITTIFFLFIGIFLCWFSLKRSKINSSLHHY
tara:strand:+ start:631 stop:1458 length:828 start_codon:yes stop_codon:yes gene_type:complete